MNHMYFFCFDCKEYIEALYRWGSSNLVRNGEVEYGAPLDIEYVLGHTRFWDPPTDPDYDWIRRELPEVRSFLHRHFDHLVRYGDMDVMENAEDNEGLDWLEVGKDPTATPRYLVDVVGLTTWEQVEEFAATWEGPGIIPWWVEVTDQTHTEMRAYFVKAKAVFHQLVEQRKRAE
jgi:hypothetical protein